MILALRDLRCCVPALLFIRPPHRALGPSRPFKPGISRTSTLATMGSNTSAEPPSKKFKKGDKPTLYHHTYWSSSPILQAMIELGVKDEYNIVEVSPKEIKEPWYKDMHPLGKIPAFVDGEGNVLLESAAIFTMLCDKHDTDHKLLPAAGDPDRYKVLEVIFFCISHLYPQLAALFEGDEDSKKRAREESEGRLVEHVAHLLRDGRKFVLGDRMSAADLFLAYELWGFQFAEPPVEKMIGHELVKGFLKRMAAMESTKAVYPGV